MSVFDTGEAGRAVALARVFRGSCLESVHFGHIAVADAGGKLWFSLGDPETGVWMRSAAKPFQVMPLVEMGGLAHFNLSGEELAVMCASHNGEAIHVQAVQSILHKIGLDENALQCGVHRPLGVDLKVVPETGDYRLLQNNCSGKHAGMLAACRMRRWPVESYLDPDHPHQRTIRETLSRFSDLPEDEIVVGVDGCSAPVFHLPLHRVARMYARLAADTGAAATVFDSMWRYADYVAGRKRFDTDIMHALRGRLVAKTGAEGLQCFAVRKPQALGIAIKIADGNNRAVPPVALKLLLYLGVLEERDLLPLRHYVAPEVRNHRHILVGRIDCPVDLFTN